METRRKDKEAGQRHIESGKRRSEDRRNGRRLRIKAVKAGEKKEGQVKRIVGLRLNSVRCMVAGKYGVMERGVRLRRDGLYKVK